MEQWEYENEVLQNEDIQVRLNARGEAGWELASLTPYKARRGMLTTDYTTTDYVAVYKRRKEYVPIHKRRKQ